MATATTTALHLVTLAVVSMPAGVIASVVRTRGGVCLVCADGASKREVAAAAGPHMTDRERDTIRRAFGAPPTVETYGPEAWPDEPIHAEQVPPSLRLEDMPAAPMRL